MYRKLYSEFEIKKIKVKILYITSPSYFDLEISLIRELSKLCDITVMMMLTPDGMKASAFSINEMEVGTRIIRADHYKGLEKYDDFIDRSQWYIANNPSNTIFGSLKLAQMIRRFSIGYDLIHVTDIRKTTFFLLPFIVRKKHKLLTVHDPIPHEKKSYIRDLFERRIPYKCFQNLLFLSESLLSQFKKRYGEDYTIYQSRLSLYDYLSKYKVLENQYGKYILFFGRKCSYKGIELLVSSFLQSNCVKQGYKLVIAGAGPIHPVPSNLSIIVIDRYIENEELATLIGNCQFVVLPYLSATQSGCLMSVFQFRKLVVATNVGDFKNVIDEMTGIIVPSNDIAELRDGIDRMDERIHISKKTSSVDFSRGNIKSWEIIARELLDNYDSIMLK